MLAIEIPAVDGSSPGNAEVGEVSMCSYGTLSNVSNPRPLNFRQPMPPPD